MSPRRIHVRVAGRVQGVFFRRTTLEEARRLGVAGFVKNRSDGTVEIEAEGSDEALEDFLRYCHRGPTGARVDQVAVTDLLPRGEVAFTLEEGE